MSPTRSATPRALRRGWRSAAAAGSWVLLAIVAFLVWPVSLGGATSYVFVSGQSMTPNYQPGDLLIARAGPVSVGDVIVYAPQGHGGAQIVHRVIGGDASGWVVQGDANDFIDPFTPSGAEVRGIVMLHVPGTGAVMNVLLSPFAWASLLLLAAALWVWPAREVKVPREVSV